jgi:hypothetical protein
MRRGILITCIIVSLAVAAAWLIPNYLPPRAVSSRSACITMLEYIQRLKNEWAARNQKSSGDVPTEEDLFGKNGLPKCPSGGDYKIGSTKENPVCSIGGPAHSLPAHP